MTDLVVTLPKDRGGVVHLGEKGDAYKYHETPLWEMGRVPTKLKNRERCFIHTEGYVRGFFLVEYQEWEGGESDEEAKEWGSLWILHFYPESWRPIKLIKKRWIQGFAYRKFSFVDVHSFLNYHREDVWGEADYTFDGYYYNPSFMFEDYWHDIREVFNFHNDAGDFIIESARWLGSEEWH